MSTSAASFSSKKPKLLVVDFDGTALGGGYEPYARFPDHFSDFLDQLDVQGCRWATNTTWDAEGQALLLKTSAIRSRPLFFMAEMGMRLWQLDGERLMKVEPYTGKTEALARENTVNSLYFFIKECLDGFIPEKMNFYGHWFDFTCAASDEQRFTDFIESFNWKEKDLKLYARKGCRIAVIHDFMGKGRILKEAAGIAGLSPEEIVVAGDEAADIQMMDPGIAKYSLCPANAVAEVKEHVRSMGGIVADKPYASGVMEAFVRLSKREGWTFNSN